MSIDFNLGEIRSLMQLAEKEAQTVLTDLAQRLPSVVLGEADVLLSGAQRALADLSAAHKKLSAAAVQAAPAPEPAPAEASPAQEPVAAEQPAQEPASEPPAEASAPEPSEQDTVALPAVPAPDAAQEDVPAQ